MATDITYTVPALPEVAAALPGLSVSPVSAPSITPGAAPVQPTLPVPAADGSSYSYSYEVVLPTLGSIPDLDLAAPVLTLPARPSDLSATPPGDAPTFTAPSLPADLALVLPTAP